MTDTIYAQYLHIAGHLSFCGYIAPHEWTRYQSEPHYVHIAIDVRAALAQSRRHASRQWGQRELLLANRHMMTPEALAIVQRVAGTVAEDGDA